MRCLSVKRNHKDQNGFVGVAIKCARDDSSVEGNILVICQSLPEAIELFKERFGGLGIVATQAAILELDMQIVFCDSASAMLWQEPQIKNVEGGDL